jgi:hypothetical protein
MMPHAQLVRVLVGAAILSAAGQVPPVTAGEAGSVSGTREASCIVRIAADRDLLPLNESLVAHLLDSSPILAEPAREVMGLAGEDIERAVTLYYNLLNEAHTKSDSVLVGSIFVAVDADAGRSRPAAEEFLRAVVQRLETALQKVGEAQAQNLRQQHAHVEQELQRVQAELEAIGNRERELLAAAGRGPLRRSLIESASVRLQGDLDDAELVLAGLAAAEQALTEQIAKVGQRAVEAAETSPVVAEMAKVVELREQRVEYLGRMHEAGMVEGTEMTAAQEQVALARVQLLERREAAAARAGAGVLEKLNQELVQKSIEFAGALARRQTLQARLADMRARNLLELSERWASEVELPRDQAERALQRLTSEQQELAARLRSLRLPEVSVIGW